ncbi:hypothetical protein N2152v2_000890 [Parachlorella kessleri]
MSGPQFASGLKLLANKTALLTGASRGIGSELARRLTEEGVSKVVSDCKTCGGTSVEEHLVDFADPKATDSFAQEAGNKGVDVLINCAGILGSKEARTQHPLEGSPDDWQRAMMVNAMAPMRLIRAVAPKMQEKGEGYIVNISDVEASHKGPQHAAYAASKAALTGFSHACYEALRPHGIKVVDVEPGNVVETGMHEKSDAHGEQGAIEPRDVAEAVMLTFRMSKNAVPEEIILKASDLKMTAPLTADLVHTTRALLGKSLETATVEDFFDYVPSKALAAICVALFALAGLTVAFQTERYGRRYMHTVSLTGFCEAAGYFLVIICILKSGKGSLFGPFVGKQMFLLLSPNLLQGGGMGIYAVALTSDTGTPQQARMGGSIVLVGLGAQLAFFLVFIVVAVWVHKHPKNGLAGTESLRKLFLGVYIVLFFLTIRNIYRFIEFCQTVVLGFPEPKDVYIIERHEAPFYTLDSIPILLCFAGFILFPPGRYLAGAAALGAIVPQDTHVGHFKPGADKTHQTSVNTWAEEGQRGSFKSGFEGIQGRTVQVLAQESQGRPVQPWAQESQRSSFKSTDSQGRPLRSALKGSRNGREPGQGSVQDGRGSVELV